MRKAQRTLDGRTGPWEANRFDCGCVITSEFTNGLGQKFIIYCAVHKAAPLLLEACKLTLESLEAELPDGHYSLNPKGSIATLAAAIEKAEGR